MFLDRLKSRIAGLALAGAALALPLAAHAGVVVKSTGPSATRYPVGTKLEDTATITLKAGDVVTVLTAEGTRVIKGGVIYDAHSLDELWPRQRPLPLQWWQTAPVSVPESAPAR